MPERTGFKRTRIKERRINRKRKRKQTTKKKEDNDDTNDFSGRD